MRVLSFKCLVFSWGIGLLAAVQTFGQGGLDTGVRIQDGTFSTTSKTSRVTISGLTNILAGTITLSNVTAELPAIFDATKKVVSTNAAGFRGLVGAQQSDADLDDLADGTLSAAKIDSAMATDAEVAAGYQPLDADLTDAADGSLTGTKVGFSDPDSLWTAGNVEAALAEMNDSINAGAANGVGAKVHWSQLLGVPAGFADGSDDGAGGAAQTPWTSDIDGDGNSLTNVASIQTDELQVGAAGAALLWKLPNGGTITNAANDVRLTNEIPYLFKSNVTASATLTASADLMVGATNVAGALAGKASATGTSGGIPYHNSATTTASSAALAANAIVVGGGAGAAPSTITTGSGINTFIGTPSSANFASALTDETGNGGGFVRAQNAQRTLTTSPGAADDTYAGVAFTGLNNSGGVTQWDAVYLNGSSQWVLADANGSGTYPARGIAVATVATANATTVLEEGVIRNDAWTWTPGGTIYLSTTAGGLTQTAPSTTADKIQVIGYAIDADTMRVKISADYGTAP